jgi:HAD superfamily hydrolase (TIGR01509 family)
MPAASMLGAAHVELVPPTRVPPSRHARAGCRRSSDATTRARVEGCSDVNVEILTPRASRERGESDGQHARSAHRPLHVERLSCCSPAGKAMRFIPPTRDYAGYIFDCDGTLVDSMPLHFRAWRAAFREHGARFEFDWELFVSRAGMPLEQTVEALNVQFATSLDPRQVVTAQLSAYRSLLAQVTAIEPVVAFARQVALRAKLAIASGGQRPEVESSLRSIGILDLFSVVVAGNEVKHGKPDPEILQRCAEGLGVAAKDCLVIEDGELGIEAARRAGMDWVRVEAVAPLLEEGW